ncbi:M20 aminoacylase family protein [Frigidibacter sp. ROC022]|uniref:M20 aminoacylase family protein n=1 Tax=Frigidibacter sp. ROC022 TaxID=2971796 RepID=UPI00215A41BF|nr:M20 aminoacylase family protein [Frigidibacter sp. ROC022]MCR8723697.1 M20 family metallopeptidase [Frigidibacter sp. ROC022]
MPILNRIAALGPEMAEWRRYLHRIPEIGFDLDRTAAYVAARLAEIGVDSLHTGIARSGIVAIIEGQAPGPTIGLRADMDALPIHEETGASHASTTPGAMHACGHDGHTAMLLGAAKYLAETRAFRGRVALIFQPAEEEGSGARVMIEDGILERFGIERIFALHNAPGMEFGTVMTAPGPIMAAVDTFEIHVTGRGGHAAMPDETADPIPALSAMASAIQCIVSRNHHALDALVVSVTQIHAGTAFNVVPGTGWLGGTVRSFDPAVQGMVRRRLAEIAVGQAAAFGLTARLDYHVGDPATVNDAAEAAFATEVAREVLGETAVDGAADRQMGAEDFGHFLEARPGAYLFLGQGPGAGLHHPAYDFNDEVAPIGASLLARLVERAQPL